MLWTSLKQLPKLQRRCPGAGNFEKFILQDVSVSPNREWPFAYALYSELGVRRTDKTSDHCHLSHVADLADEKLHTCVRFPKSPDHPRS